MPLITVEGEKTIEAEAGKKLVLCLEDGGIDVLHVLHGARNLQPIIERG